MNTKARGTWVLLLSLICIIAPRTPVNAQTTSSEKVDWMKALPPVPELAIPNSVQDWEQRRPQIRAQLLSLLGRLPPRPAKPEVRVVSRKEHTDYTVEKIEFDNGAGATVPGYVILPAKRTGPAPALLYCHWHGGHYDIGKEELFGTNATPVPAGPELARQGYVVIAVDAYCFGERNGAGPGGPAEKGGAGEMSASKFNLWAGRSLWGMMLRDDLMALDYLVTRPEVDAKRVGVTGISMGATRTWWLMALDERLRAGVAVCCLTRYQNLIAESGLKYHGIYYFVPGMLTHFDTETVVALAAPRPMLFLSGELDSGSPVDGIRTIESKVAPIYGLYGKGSQFRSIIYPGVGHLYTPDMWAKMLDWMKKNLQ